MSISWNINSSLLEGVAILNKIELDIFETIINNTEYDFSNKSLNIRNQERLKECSKLTQVERDLLFATLKVIMEKSSRVIMKPKELGDELTELLKLDKNKTEVFIKLWSNNVNEILKKITNEQLDKVVWELYSEIASSTETKLNTPKANIQLGLISNENDDKKNILLELNHEQLFKFYNELELIQQSLDSLKRS